MAKHLCSICVNKIEVLIFNSDSEEEFTSRDSDIECQHDLPEYSVDYCFKK
jgi:hypothetical protein